MSWRDSQADALDEQAGVIDTAVEAIDVADDVLASRRREQTCHELRAVMALLRSEASAIRSEASALRSESNAPLPMAVTTRFPRRRELPARLTFDEGEPYDRDGHVHEPQTG